MGWVPVRGLQLPLLVGFSCPWWFGSLARRGFLLGGSVLSVAGSGLLVSEFGLLGLSAEGFGSQLFLFIYSEVYTVTDLFFYIVGVVLVLAFVGEPTKMSRVEVACEIEPFDVLECAEVEEVVSPVQREVPKAVALPGNEGFDLFTHAEVEQAIANAKAINLSTLTPAEIRELCRDNGIAVGDRGRIPQSVISQLAQVLEVSDL